MTRSQLLGLWALHGRFLVLGHVVPFLAAAKNRRHRRAIRTVTAAGEKGKEADQNKNKATGTRSPFLSLLQIDVI